MPAPVFREAVGNYNVGNAFMIVNRPATAQVGDYMIVGIHSSVGQVTATTPPANWTLLTSVSHNTRGLVIFVKEFTGSEPLTYQFNMSGGAPATAVTAVIGGAATPNLWVLGSAWTRVNNGGSQTGITIPGVLAAANSAVVSVFGEATITTNPVDPISTYTGTLWGGQDEVSGHIESLYFGKRTVVEPSMTPQETVDFAPAASSNGVGLQIMIPSPGGGPAPGGTVVLDLPDDMGDEDVWGPKINNALQTLADAVNGLPAFSARVVILEVGDPDGTDPDTVYVRRPA